VGAEVQRAQLALSKAEVFAGLFWLVEVFLGSEGLTDDVTVGLILRAILFTIHERKLYGVVSGIWKVLPSQVRSLASKETEIENLLQTINRRAAFQKHWAADSATQLGLALRRQRDEIAERYPHLEGHIDAFFSALSERGSLEELPRQSSTLTTVAPEGERSSGKG
jgi:hypothetical protein